MSGFAKAYLSITLTLFFCGVLWVLMTLQENADKGWIHIVFWVLQFDLHEPFIKKDFAIQISALIAGLAIPFGLLMILAIRAPFRIRSEANKQRKIRELQREVLELRTLPLRQKEEDEILAAEAHIEIRPKKVMTEKIRHENHVQQLAQNHSFSRAE